MNRRFGQPRLPRGILHTLTEIRVPSPTYDAENGGQWVPGTPERIDFEGCVLPVSEDDWKTAAEGTYTANSRKIYTNGHVLRIGGQYYHLDATFDNSLQRGVKRYDYCNLDDSRCFRDHESLVFPIPACTDGRAFYYRNVSFTKPEELEKRLAQALRKKQPVFVFHWRGGGLNRQILAELLAVAGKQAQARGKQASCSVNVPQAVIQLQFSDAPEPDITIQQANEGEAAPETQTVSE